MEAALQLRSNRSPFILIIIAEILLAIVSCFAIYSISWDNIVDRRSDVIYYQLKNFDTVAVTGDVKACVKEAREQIVEERDESMWTTESVNYRSGPAKSYEILGTLNAYAHVQRTGITYNKWSRVIVNDEECYINNKFLTDEEPIYFDGGTKGEYQRYAYSLFEDYGWDRDEMNPLIYLWNRESGWNPSAHNGGSGAHGIPQALPASKMAAYGSDYYTNGNTQIRWGLNYIANRYGSPANAWRHFTSSGWY